MQYPFLLRFPLDENKVVPKSINREKNKLACYPSKFLAKIANLHYFYITIRNEVARPNRR